MPSTGFVSEILEAMSDAVAEGRNDDADRICRERLAVELGTPEAALVHLAAMKRHRDHQLNVQTHEGATE